MFFYTLDYRCKKRAQHRQHQRHNTHYQAENKGLPVQTDTHIDVTLMFPLLHAGGTEEVRKKFKSTVKTLQTLYFLSLNHTCH